MEGEDGEAMPVDQLQGLVELTQMVNIVELIPEEKRAKIVEDVLRGYDVDDTSREDWLKRAEKGVKLAAQHPEEKSNPFPGAANALHPVITQAAMQFNARALPAILPDGDVVKTAVHGADPQGQKQERANRVSKFTSYQLRTKVRGWAADTDTLLARLPIEGHLFRKFSHDPIRNQTITKLYSAAQVVVNEGAESLERAPRISEMLELYPDQIFERIASGLYEEFDWKGSPPEDEDGEGDWQEDENSPQLFIQQYTRFDLDEDGYPEPYICVVHKATQTLVRVIANFTEGSIFHKGGKVMAIEPEIYFVDYRFFPSLDGGYHGFGLAHLVGNNIEVVNSVINRMLDAESLAGLGGGLIGRGVNLKAPELRFKPGEWKSINASGQSIRESMVQINYPGASPVMFQLLGLLIETSKEVASINNFMTGDNIPANMPATTVTALIEQGAQVFNAAFKRIWESMKGEFTILCRINARFLDPEQYSRFHDMRAEPQPGEQMPQQGQMVDPAQDFSLEDMDIEPVADPRAVTSLQGLSKAQAIREMSAEGSINPVEATKRVLKALAVDDIEALLPTPDPQQQAMEQRKAQLLEQLNMRGLEATVMKTEAEAQDKQASAIERQAGALERQAGAKQKEASALVSIASAEAAEEGQDVERYQRTIDRHFEQRKLDLEELALIERFQDNADRRRTERMAKLAPNRSGSGGN